MAARLLRLPAWNQDEAPLLEFEWELPLDKFRPERWQVVVDLANDRLLTIEADLRDFTPVDTGQLLDSLAIKFASVFDASIGAVYAETENRHGWYVDKGWSNPETGASFPGYHFFDRIVQAHLTRLDADIDILSIQLA